MANARRPMEEFACDAPQVVGSWHTRSETLRKWNKRPASPPVEGTRINAGKKSSFVKPAEFPTFAGNDYREAMATTPGIIVSEEPQSPIINFGYRGLNSQRSEFMQVLEDGISLKNEQFGFPETHYTPILDAVERIELIRAGAALQYGCQPGGALNFVMKMPRLDAPFHFTTS